MEAIRSKNKERVVTKQYLGLIHKFPLMPISNERQLKLAIEVMRDLMTRFDKLTTSENAYLSVLGDLIAKYEKEHFRPLSAPMTPAEALQFLLEESGITQTELAKRTGVQQSHISEYISGKRDLGKDSVVRLANYFRVTTDLFLPQIT
jgi:HTH-type transcriptional regulator/antitoxin HigA